MSFALYALYVLDLSLLRPRAFLSEGRGQTHFRLSAKMLQHCTCFPRVSFCLGFWSDECFDPQNPSAAEENTSPSLLYGKPRKNHFCYLLYF